MIVSLDGLELDAGSAFCRCMRERVLQFEFGGCNIVGRTLFLDSHLFHDMNFDLHRITSFGVAHLRTYRESHECFATTDLIVTNRRQRRGD